MKRPGTMPGRRIRALCGALGSCARINRVNDTEPSRDGTEYQRYKGQQCADGHDRGGGIGGLSSHPLRLVDGLVVLRLHLRDLLLRLIEGYTAGARALGCLYRASSASTRHRSPMLGWRLSRRRSALRGQSQLPHTWFSIASRGLL